MLAITNSSTLPITYSEVAHEIIWLPILIAGRIPLRQLVYRVLDLPTSMRPLVYDFGQLNTQTEEDYTNQIVLDHVRIHICNSDMFLWSHVICVILSCHVICDPLSENPAHPKFYETL